MPNMEAQKLQLSAALYIEILTYEQMKYFSISLLNLLGICRNFSLFSYAIYGVAEDVFSLHPVEKIS